VCASAASAWAQAELAKLSAAPAAPGTEYGRSVAIHGRICVVGSWKDGHAGRSAGSAHVHEFDEAGGYRTTRLTPPNPSAWELFGGAVAIHGNVLAVGAASNDDRAKDAGIVYVFAREQGEWSFQARIAAEDAGPRKFFGQAVAAFEDRLVVGASYDNVAGEKSGSAYVFRRTNDQWKQEAKLTASDAGAQDRFGNAVALSGTTIVVGAQFGDYTRVENAGAVYVFEFDGRTWVETAKLTADDPGRPDWFGACVSISGERILVGAVLDDHAGRDSGSAYVFERSANGWKQTAKLCAPDVSAGDWFGGSVSLDADTAVVGAGRDDDAGNNAGAAYVFRHDGNRWQLRAKLTASDGAPGHEFAAAVAVDGPLMVCGAGLDSEFGPKSGAAYVFALGTEQVADDAKRAPASVPTTAKVEVAPHAVAATGRTICAVLPKPGVPIAKTVADVLEAQLDSTAAIDLVNRSDLEKVLAEQTLSAAFTPEGITSRVQLGRIAKADLLVFLQVLSGPDGQAVEASVAETRRGLRLVGTQRVWRSDAVQAIATAFVDAVRKGRTLAADTNLRVFAVPPFESEDFATEHEHQRRGFARVVEAMLASVPATAVVELTEAQALARETTLGGETIARTLPYYIFGEYQSSRTEGGTEFHVTTKLRHGAAVVAESRRAHVSASGMGTALHETTHELVSAIPGIPTITFPTAVEARLLAGRGNVFRQIGEWDMAIPLYESALLLDTDNVEANMHLLEWHTEQMVSGGPWDQRRKGLSYSPAGRVRHAGRSIAHAEAVIRSGNLSAELLWRLNRFEGFFHLYGYDAQADPDRVLAQFQRVAHRRSEMVLDLLANPQQRARLSDDQLHRVARHAVVRRANRSSPDREACDDSIVRLLHVLDDGAAPASMLLKYALRAGWGQAEPDEVVLAFWRRLDASDAPRIRSVARTVRLLHGIRDRESFEKVWHEINDHVASLGLPNRYAGWVRYHAKKRLSSLQGPPKEPVVDHVALPQLKPLADQLEAYDANGDAFPFPLHLSMWLSVGPDIEIFGASTGLYRVEDDTRVVRVVAPAIRGIDWDGRHLWVQAGTEILVLDPSGRQVAQFTKEELNREGGSSVSLVAVRPGLACVIGHPPNSDRRKRRTWIGLLEVQCEEAEGARTRIETILGARGLRDQSKVIQRSGPETAFRPRWAAVLPAQASRGGPWVVVERGLAHPLIIDVATKKARVPKMLWERWPRAAQREASLYVAAGWIGQYREHSFVYRMSNENLRPRAWVDFGRRPGQVKGTMHSAYYHSIAVVGDWLHLLAGSWGRHGDAVPAWSAVHLKTKDVRVLMTQFPDDFKRSKDEQLAASARFGLVLLSRGKPYRVELPPVDTWPPMPSFDQ